MAKLLIINGYPGVGKSSVAFAFAKENNYAILSQDAFLFEFNAIRNSEKEFTGDEHRVAIKNMYDCMANYMAIGKDIVIEGALVSISENDPLDLSIFIEKGNQLNYKIVIVTLIADERVRNMREKERHYTVPKKIDQLLINALRTVDKKIGGESVIDTSHLSIDEVVSRLEEIVGI